ncbi:MAG: carboxypeptidase-like regulatory domain-containing protein [Bacteroidia bacterium]|nr:carboxypeptidase-like regulatory domain-containing protein [Bacteroidia bacterium]
MIRLGILALVAGLWAQEERLVRGLISTERLSTVSRQETAIEVRGWIRDAETKEPLAGAMIRLLGTDYGTLSQLDGRFAFSFNPKEAPQDPKLLITYIGYEEKVLPLSEVEKGINIELKPSGVAMKEVLIVASTANTLLTPLNFTRMDSRQIIEMRGSQEVTEAMRFSPSVYASREGGGWGDSRINLRGFSQENIAVQINGIPVNDMENARIYWSNWIGLTDVIDEVQVQKGVGNARIVLPSIGGTLNLRTLPPQSERRFILTSEASNVYSARLGFAYHSGLSPKGWAVTLAGNRAVGPGYVPGTDLSSWTYYVAISKNIGTRHRLMLQAFGAPQWHYHRFTYLTQRDVDTLKRSIFHNYDYGYLQGQKYSNLLNFYHKPLISLSHFWNISERIQLLTSVYASFGRGGGSGILSRHPSWQNDPRRNYRLSYTPEGLIDWDRVRTDHLTKPRDTIIRASGDTVFGRAAFLIHRNSINYHDWYGAISALNLRFGALEINTGLDVRTYVASHFRELTNLFGADFWIDTFDVRNGEPMRILVNGRAVQLPNARLTRLGDKVNYYYRSYVTWIGGFGEARYDRGPISAAVVLAAANTTYRREELFRYRPEVQPLLSPNVNIFSFTTKAGIGLRITDQSLVYLNGGYFTRPPFFNLVFINDRAGNEIDRTYTVEKVFQVEGGVRWQSSLVAAQVGAYWINWRDKALMLSVPLPGGLVSQTRITGLSALHRGVEAEFGLQPLPWLRLSAIGSIGDWKWEDDVSGFVRDNNQQIVDTVTLYIKGLRVGSAPQTQIGGVLRITPTPSLYFFVNYFYYDRFWADYDPLGRQDPNDRAQPWRIPGYGLMDIGAGYEVSISSETRLRFFGNVHNLLNTRYIVTALDGRTHDRSTARFFYGFQRNWNVGLALIW